MPTRAEFAQSIKTKYPQYQGIDDSTLVDRMLEKYPQYQEKITDDAPAPAKHEDARGDVTLMEAVFPRASKATSESKGLGSRAGASLLDLVSLPGRAVAASTEHPIIPFAYPGDLNSLGKVDKGPFTSEGGKKFSKSLSDTKGSSLLGQIVRDPGAAAALATAPLTGGLSLPIAGAIGGAASAAAHQGDRALEGKGVSPAGAAGEVALNAALPYGAKKLGTGLKYAGKGYMQSILKPSEFLREKTNLDMGDLIETLGSMRPFKGSIRGMGKTADALEKNANKKYGEIVAENADVKIDPKEALSKTGLGLQKEFEVGKKHFDVYPSMERGGKKIGDRLEKQGVPEGGNTLPEAVELRKSVGRMGKYNANKDPRDLEGETQFAREMYNNLSEQEAAKVPDLKPVKEELSKLYPMQEAVANAQGRMANNFYPGLTDNIALNAAAQADSWDKTIPGTIMFLANRTLKSPSAATTAYKAGKALENQGPGVTAAQAALLRALGQGFRGD